MQMFSTWYLNHRTIEGILLRNVQNLELTQLKKIANNKLRIVIIFNFNPIWI